MHALALLQPCIGPLLAGAALPRKAVFVYPLAADFRAALGVAACAHWPWR